MQDGLILMYVKDGTGYPVAMTQEQWDILQFIVPTMILNGKVRVVEDRPVGRAVNLIEKEG